jgi:hypothetical protein
MIEYIQEQKEAVGNDPLLMGSSSGSGMMTTSTFENVNSFATNNQEINVDEADVVQSNGRTGTI